MDVNPFDTTVVMVDDDDHDDDGLMLRTASRRAGHDRRHLHFPGGQDLLTAAGNAVLSERMVDLPALNRPTIDGCAAWDHLRDRPAGRQLPVVVRNIAVEPTLVDRVSARGVSALLTKPNQFGETTSVVAELITHWLSHGRVPSTLCEELS